MRARRAELAPGRVPADISSAIDECIELLDSGRARVAEPKDGQWVVNEWLKKAVLLYFRSHDNVVVDAGYTRSVVYDLNSVFFGIGFNVAAAIRKM